LGSIASCRFFAACRFLATVATGFLIATALAATRIATAFATTLLALATVVARLARRLSVGAAGVGWCKAERCQHPGPPVATRSRLGGGTTGFNRRRCSRRIVSFVAHRRRTRRRNRRHCRQVRDVQMIAGQRMDFLLARRSAVIA